MTQYAMIHHWLPYLRPILLISSLAVCNRNLPVSRHMTWLVLGFGIHTTEWFVMFVSGMSFAGQNFYARISVFDSLLNIWAWLLIVVGLAQVLAEFQHKSGVPKTDQDQTLAESA